MTVLDDIRSAARWLSEMPPLPTEIQVGPEAYRRIRGGEYPRALHEVMSRLAGLPPALHANLRIVLDIPTDEWRALSGDGEVLASGTFGVVLVRGLGACVDRWARENCFAPSQVRRVRDDRDFRAHRGARLVLLGCADRAPGSFRVQDAEHFGLAIEGARCP